MASIACPFPLMVIIIVNQLLPKQKNSDAKPASHASSNLLVDFFLDLTDTKNHSTNHWHE
ncbi:hypothetical protein MiSe_61680 [Microseira wollei NIES-4236]|uniref:Uncharacterized protein n=1 Tax=Microseira wollei NIES-4236 TaxID=2530354 RepID=A0AAV3XIN5_9CYAN|nr:hypothetical protein MiSe_61680 [Microseira wollei NIES-4236]